MKMDAAEPFNVPVDPIALGIPVSVFYKFPYKRFFLSSFDISHLFICVLHYFLPVILMDLLF